MMNRLANCTNKYQGNYKRVLAVCSAALLRSPSIALVLSQEPFNFNTRAAGISFDFALIPVDPVLLEWCDEVVCSNQEVFDMLAAYIKSIDESFGPFEKPIHNFEIPDVYAYRDPKMLKLIRRAAEKVWSNPIVILPAE